MSKDNLDTENKLMLLQGITLIQNGLQFLEWMLDFENENSFDALTILRNRFQFFRECALAGKKCGLIFIDRANDSLENVEHSFRLNEKVKNELKELRNAVSVEMYKEE
ncbi:hypothetical protein JL193_13095 [Polaribacter batillariae]|uniref:Uncharacterized protein n=1 Tax=Polaribacter batillariae TaxID=2808900 RepID=A0ABX7SW18_9FLAO|nr:hypothetical protein [Polaribacter batillariae]QTD37048.1 hypothetical protein JL193_13095 [Polaribacter batillariae]